MSIIARYGRRVSPPLIIAAAIVFALSSTFAALANVALTKLSTDPYTNTTSQHQTEVEPDTFAFGTTIVAATQVGRFSDGGSSNIGWATSTDSGATWTNGFLPGITTVAGGPFDRVSDPSVAYDARHNVWMIASLPLTGTDGVGVLVNRSTNGGTTWGNPVSVASHSGLDKDWIACDDTASSPHYGNCYVEWDDNGAGNVIHMSTSTDGGAHWGAAQNTANNATGLGGQPVIQPNGTVVVPIANANDTAILAFTSTNGGTSWGSTVTIATVTDHTEAGNLRSGPLPSAEIDGTGKVYVVWQDCRFRAFCLANDIVMSTSTNGTTWSVVTRIPIDGTGSGVDHFIPGIAVDNTTSGGGAHLGLTYYYYPTSNCSASTCQLDVGFVSSANGGATWSAATQIAGPMTLSWLARTTQGRMVGDYISTSFLGGTAHPAIAVASAKSGGAFRESMETTASGLSVTPPSIAAGNAAVTTGGEQPVPDAASDHPAPHAPLTSH